MTHWQRHHCAVSLADVLDLQFHSADCALVHHPDICTCGALARVVLAQDPQVDAAAADMVHGPDVEEDL